MSVITTGTQTAVTAGEQISVEEAARIIGVSRQTLYRRIAENTLDGLPVYRVFGRYKVDRGELLAWLKSEEKPPLTVDQLTGLLGRDVEWLNRQAMAGLPCQWNGRGELVAVQPADLPAWRAMAEGGF